MRWQNINRYTEPNHLVWDRLTFLGIFLLLVCGIKITWGIEQYMDVLFWDEALYLHRGLALFDHIPKTWGPSYSLWYKLLSYIIPDKIALYYFNFKFTAILMAVVLFLLLLSGGVHRLLSFLLSLFFLSSYINLPVWPRVSHFCVIVFLLGLIVAKQEKRLLSKLIWVSFSLLICAYARPELFIAFACSFSLVILISFWDIKSLSKRDWLGLTILVLVSAFIFIVLKTPFNNGDSGRGLRVFLQHFAWGYNERLHLDNVFWLDFPDLIKQQFKDATSLKEILTSNPKAFQEHILYNLYNYLLELGKILISFFVPVSSSPVSWAGCILILIIYWSSVKITPNVFQRFKEMLLENIFTLLLLLLFTVPTVFACIYAYPRQHYLVLQLPLLLLLTALFISSVFHEQQQSLRNMIFLGFIWIVLAPGAGDFKYFDLFRKERSLCNVTTLRYIQEHVKTKDSVRVFDVEGYMTNLLPSNFTNYNEIYYRNRSALISSIIQDNKIDIVYVTPSMCQLNSTPKDTALCNMLKYPERYGFFEQKTGNFAPVLLIKRKQ